MKVSKEKYTTVTLTNTATTHIWQDLEHDFKFQILVVRLEFF